MLACIALFPLLPLAGQAQTADGNPTAEPHPELWATPPPSKSIALYVGSNLTADGSVLLGGFGHEPSSHWYEITPARTFPPGTSIEVGITEDARIPGRRTTIPQAARTLRYITTNYSEFAGFPPPLTNGGLNERLVAARDVWSPSRPELREMTPVPQTGLNYSDLSRMAMERAGTAREAARLVGRLVEEHGYATYGGNSHLFADAEEGWVLIDYAGGQGLWAAERLGPDEVRVSYPGYIGDFPVDFEDDPDFMGSPNLVSFAVEQGWWDPASGAPFNLHDVYGQPFPSAPGQDDPHTLFRDPPLLEEQIRAIAPVRLEDMMALVRDVRWSNDGSGYGQVAQLRADTRPELGTLWMSITGAVASPFVPVPLGASDVPPEFKQHRYMTKDADDDFLDAEYAPLEATRSAFRVHKRLLYHTCEHPEVFLEPVTAALEAFEADLVERHAELVGRADALLAEGDSARARALLSEATERSLLAGLGLGERLVDRVEAETRARFGIRLPDVRVAEGGSWRPESESMTQRPGRTYHRCLREGVDTEPRRHGSWAEQAEVLVPAGAAWSGPSEGAAGSEGGGAGSEGAPEGPTRWGGALPWLLGGAAGLLLGLGLGTLLARGAGRHA